MSDKLDVTKPMFVDGDPKRPATLERIGDEDTSLPHCVRADWVGTGASYCRWVGPDGQTTRGERVTNGIRLQVGTFTMADLQDAVAARVGFTPTPEQALLWVRKALGL